MGSVSPVSSEVNSTLLDAPGDQRVIWAGIGWDGYQALLELQGDQSRPQILYLDGDVILMSPSRTHERRTDRLGTLVREVFMALEIPCIATRETTFRRGPEEGGVQPDDSFYFQNADRIANKDEDADIDLLIDPPPDLVIEVVHKHDSTPAVQILQRFGVPEVWVSYQNRLVILILGDGGQYFEAPQSRIYPFLAAAELHEWATREDLKISTAWTGALRRWIAEVVSPRARPHQ